MRTAIVFDTETTGLLKPDEAPLKDQPKIIEFYGIKIGETMQPIDTLHLLINPEIPLPAVIKKLTGISDEDVVNEPTFAEYYRTLAEFFLGADTLIAHNAPFDVAMLENELRRIDRLTQFPWPIRHICTASVTKEKLGSRMRLGALYQSIMGKPIENAHRAQSDVEALLACFTWMVEQGHIE